MAMSVRGIARRYRGIAGPFPVKARLLIPFWPYLPTGSLRHALEITAAQEHEFDVDECIYGWAAGFEQTWSHITVRIRLDPNAGIPASTINNLQTVWANGIRTTWNNRWGVGFPHEATCPLTFNVQWVTSNEHHVVEVRQGSGRANMGTWYTQSSGSVAAHEFGHMLGLVDEYADSTCPDRSPVNTGTVMDNNSANIPSRMMTRFAANIGSNVVAI